MTRATSACASTPEGGEDEDEYPSVRQRACRAIGYLIEADTVPNERLL